MQKHRNKLALGRETIRTLQRSELGNIAGGARQSGGHITLADGANPTNTGGKPTAQPISVLTE